ncbi:MAG: SRPBCC domain-containing protein [Saprospiraceae bacterium]|nr:SRPBCC domain-containing protein [Saprospiraceae bacterium]
MNRDFIASASILIERPVEVIWNALLDPEQIKLYFFGVEVETTWKVGSPIIYRGAWDGNTFEDKGTILEVVHGQKLVSNYWSGFSGLPDEPKYYQNVCYELMSNPRGTTLSVTQDNLPSEEKAEQVQKDWMGVLSSMKKLLEE